jgi:hypothetical protein
MPFLCCQGRLGVPRDLHQLRNEREEFVDLTSIDWPDLYGLHNRLNASTEPRQATQRYEN